MAGGFGCCFRPSQDDSTSAISSKQVKTAPSTIEAYNTSATIESLRTGTGPLANAVSRELRLSDTYKTLTRAETNAVQDTLQKVGELIERFSDAKADGKSGSSTIAVLKKALAHVVADCRAAYGSVVLLSDGAELSFTIASVGSSEAVAAPPQVQLVSGSNNSVERILSSRNNCFMWRRSGNLPPPSDWQPLAKAAGLSFISGVPIRAGEELVGTLNVGFVEEEPPEVELRIWPTYLQLLAATFASHARDPVLHKYVALVRDVQLAQGLDSLMHRVLQAISGVALGGHSNYHMWFRLALVSSDHSTATLFDDLSQVPPALMQRSLSASGSLKQLRESSGGAVLRSAIPMKNTILKIALANRKQVLIPDVQKLINQLGNVSTDLFNTRLIKPPTSVLVFPLKTRATGIYGALFCMSSVQWDFSDVSPRVKELCDLLSPHLLRMLSQPLAQEYASLQRLTASQLTEEVAANGPGLLTNGVASTSGSTTRDSGLLLLESLRSSASSSFTSKQLKSSTGALVTGLTEKLNQKRIRSSLNAPAAEVLRDLQVVSLLGEGGFAKVFRGEWRGLVVAVKVVADDATNDKLVMKNAHEIAILAALSHPNIIQAYVCLTDVLVRDVLSICVRHSSRATTQDLLCKDTGSVDDAVCHIEVIEYCDLGNLSSAIKQQVFHLPPLPSSKPAASSSAAGAPPPRINMRALTLTLIEISSAMSYLHSMGVVHCDMKPANVLLRSSNIDSRGFTAKVSDFGLSRVEDDESCSTFPFNSCGTAAYVAPEALISNKKVNSSVDVYAFGIMMWEVYTGQRPYGNMKQQTLVEEVVLRGLRPKFPRHAPPAYVQLAQSCWNALPGARPTFDEANIALNQMLAAVEDEEGGGEGGQEQYGGYAGGGELFDRQQAAAAAGRQQQAVPPPQQSFARKSSYGGSCNDAAAYTDTAAAAAAAAATNGAARYGHRAGTSMRH